MSKAHTRKRGETRKPTRTKKDDRNDKKAANAAPPGGGFIGRRVGRSSKDLGDVLKRPEKLHGDYPVDTAKKGVSATDKKAGGGSTARRNAKKDDDGASYALEDSVTGTPSRKSTRKSTNRIKTDSNLQQRATREVSSPQARATRASARQTKVRGKGANKPSV
ncbi:MAG: hypothetical protein M3Y87_26610 [Myxococcota bacterium]|nr:hypothetical protein [Myxococcota bacterium]